jgi:hypothetical protein
MAWQNRNKSQFLWTISSSTARDFRRVSRMKLSFCLSWRIYNVRHKNRKIKRKKDLKWMQRKLNKIRTHNIQHNTTTTATTTTTTTTIQKTKSQYCICFWTIHKPRLQLCVWVLQDPLFAIPWIQRTAKDNKIETTIIILFYFLTESRKERKSCFPKNKNKKGPKHLQHIFPSEE